MDNIISEYNNIKRKFVQNIEFDKKEKANHYRKNFDHMQKMILLSFIIICADKDKEFEPLQMVHLYVGTPTYDLIEKDVKITFTTFISLVGGYMGLFTGFSILSGVEIIYHLVAYFSKLVTPGRKG